MSRSLELTAGEISDVQRSFDLMWSRSGAMVDAFYARLFELVPEARELFRDDMTELKRKFISTLAVIVGSLDDITGLWSVTDKLARDHVKFGVLADHYEPVGEALLWSLQQGLGAEWTPRVASAWTKLYAVLSDRMKTAAYC